MSQKPHLPRRQSRGRLDPLPNSSFFLRVCERSCRWRLIWDFDVGFRNRDITTVGTRQNISAAKSACRQHRVCGHCFPSDRHCICRFGHSFVHVRCVFADIYSACELNEQHGVNNNKVHGS